MNNLPHGFIKTYWNKKSLYDKSLIAGSVIFLGLIAFFVILHRVFFTPDQFYAIAFVFVLFTGQAKKFVWDWTPVILLILSYEYLRGLVPAVNPHVHFALMPKFDLLLLGHIPSVVLQNRLFDPYKIHWYDYAAVILYLMHFVVPMLTAFVFWLSDRDHFKEYVIAMIGLSYLTFFTYLVFPAAPPWMAAQLGVIPPITHITGIILSHFFGPLNIPNVYGFFGANLTAAVPSLHAAFPLLSAIYIYRKAPKLAPLLVMYVLGVWFSVMYLGEHYFFDVVLGATYVLFIYAVLQRAAWYRRRKLENKVPAQA